MLNEERKRFQQQLERMSDADREILCLRHFERLSHAEIALVLEVPEATARKRYTRALARFEQALQAPPDIEK